MEITIRVLNSGNGCSPRKITEGRKSNWVYSCVWVLTLGRLLLYPACAQESCQAAIVTLRYFPFICREQLSIGRRTVRYAKSREKAIAKRLTFT